jgi:hypothetical protein
MLQSRIILRRHSAHLATLRAHGKAFMFVGRSLPITTHVNTAHHRGRLTRENSGCPHLLDLQFVYLYVTT